MEIIQTCSHIHEILHLLGAIFLLAFLCVGEYLLPPLQQIKSLSVAKVGLIHIKLYCVRVYCNNKRRHSVQSRAF